MYITGGQCYYSSSGEQRASKGHFLILFSDHKIPGMFACVRKVALRQWGHWMMGRANIGGKWVSVSGAYGADGLSKPLELKPKDAVRVPDELVAAWLKGGGWNSAGTEAPMMREWAIKTFLRKQSYE